MRATNPSRRKGEVFTPPALARELARALARHLPAGAELFDPACGEGALLMAAAELLGRRKSAGIEIDPGLAVRAARRGLRVQRADALETPWPANSAILANPPWVSFSGRHAAPGSGSRAGGWPSLHGAFLQRIAAHVHEERTVAAVLLPASCLELEQYGPLRRAVTKHAHLLEPPRELEAAAFQGVLEPACLVLLGPGPPPTGPSERPWSAPAAADLLALLADCPRLPARSFTDPGVHTGNAARALLRTEPGPGRIGVRRGRELNAYRLAGPELWLRTDLRPAGELWFRVRAPECYAEFPVLLRQTADRPIAALHAPVLPFRNSLLACRARPELDPAFLVAVLNSPVAAFFHRASHRDARQKRFPQVKVSHLAGQPMPIARRTCAPARHDRIVAEVRRLGGRAPDAEEHARIEAGVLELFGLPPDAVEAMRRFAQESQSSSCQASSRPAAKGTIPSAST